MSAAKCSVCLMVVLVAAECAARAQERIKMCGRELILLAVSSCGNSHLRRSVPDADLSQHRHASHYLFSGLLSSEMSLKYVSPPSSGDQDASTEERQATEALRVTPESEGEKDVFSLAPYWHPKGCSMKEQIQFC
uniref:Insulin-like domain-containing protein n=1 Tax=Mola mola TaxID=94237 RepID=A0A3Q3VXW6_MOLML